ncbi:MAG: hypothetical protein PHE55_07800 [Methylococcaceae bacterium]|nr:hypothetical protein [Methylococcaceae bacterium]
MAKQPWTARKGRYKSLVFGFLVYMGTLGVAGATTVYLTPSTQTVTAGSSATLELWMDFRDEPTLGGYLDILFNDSLGHNALGGALSFTSFTAAGLGDPALARAPDLLADRLSGIGFADIGGLSGPAKIGTLLLGAHATGNYTLSLTDSAAWGGFLSFNGGNPQVPLYTPAQLSVQASHAPSPATGWLLLVGLLSLAGLKVPMRKR